MSCAAPCSNRKITRQFALTVTAQKPFSSPFSGCSRRLARLNPNPVRRFQQRQDQAQLGGMFGIDALRAVRLVEPLQILVSETADHGCPVVIVYQCNVLVYICQQLVVTACVCRLAYAALGANS